MKAPENNMWFFIRLFKPHGLRMGLGSFLGWLAVMASVGLLALAGWFISASAFAGLTLATAYLFNFFYPSVAVRIFAITRTLARYAERLITHDATFRMLSTLRVWFYRQLEPLAPACLMKYRSADILNRIVADIESLDNLYVRVLSPTLVALLTVVAVVFFLGIFDPWIAVAALLFLLLAGVAVPLAAGRAGAGMGRQLARHTGELRIRVVEGLQGLSELMVYGSWNQQLDALGRESDALIRIQGRMSRIRGLATGATTLLTGLAVVACLYIGVERVGSGVLNGANLALVGFAILAAFEAVLPLPWAYQYLGQTREAGRRLLELVNAPPEVGFPEASAQKIDRFDIRFEHVDFRYGDSEPWVLKAFDIHIQEGQRVAIIGETGAGKSTLLNLMVRFWNPVKGSIKIGGHDISTMAEPDLRRAITVVSQQTHLFNQTLRENLRMARPGADDTALKSALEKARLLDFVAALPRGLDTWIGEGGRALSGGQVRRLNMARAFLHDAPIWVLDEPTESLDRITEQQMMQSLLSATKERTVLFITHRWADLEQFDEIIKLDRGRIVDKFKCLK
jgi:ATP-binding cassette, subfamily C, bacterial CydC